MFNNRDINKGAIISLGHPRYDPTDRDKGIDTTFSSGYQHFYLRARTKAECDKAINEIRKDSNIKNMYVYFVGVAPGIPVPVPEYTYEIAVNEPNTYGVLGYVRVK